MVSAIWLTTIYFISKYYIHVLFILITPISCYDRAWLIKDNDKLCAEWRQLVILTIAYFSTVTIAASMRDYYITLVIYWYRKMSTSSMPQTLLSCNSIGCITISMIIRLCRLGDAKCKWNVYLMIFKGVSKYQNLMAPICLLLGPWCCTPPASANVRALATFAVGNKQRGSHFVANTHFRNIINYLKPAE